MLNPRLILLLSALTLTLTVAAIALQTKVINPAELTVAKWGTDNFVRQVASSSGAYIVDAGQPIFNNQKLAIQPPQPLPQTGEVLGINANRATDGTEKWIEVDTSDQQLIAWEGNRQVYKFPVSTGLPGMDTVKGEFRVWRKVLNQAYKGGSRERGTYYYLPNVPFSLFFHKGYAIHGAYWHNDFGIRPRSHGCVNMRIPDAEVIYNWAGPAMPQNTRALNSSPDNPGIRIVVHD